MSLTFCEISLTRKDTSVHLLQLSDYTKRWYNVGIAGVTKRYALTPPRVPSDSNLANVPDSSSGRNDSKDIKVTLNLPPLPSDSAEQEGIGPWEEKALPISSDYGVMSGQDTGVAFFGGMY